MSREDDVTTSGCASMGRASMRVGTAWRRQRHRVTKKLSGRLPYTGDLRHAPYLNNELPLSTDTEASLQDVFHYLREFGHGRDVNGSIARRIQTLLGRCCEGHSSMSAVASYVDNGGYDVMQWAVAVGSVAVVRYILESDYDIRLVVRPCTSPLHLACKRGNLDIVRLFLAHGAAMGYKSAVCFPTQHFTRAPEGGGPVSNFQYRMNTQRSYCCSRKVTLLESALNADNVKLLELLLDHDSSRKILDLRWALHTACRKEALKCLALLLPRLPDQINRRLNGTDSLIRVAFDTSGSCGMVLLNAKLPWSEHVLLNAITDCQESLLHTMYRCETLTCPLAATQLALRNCFPREHVDVRDIHGNTPLLFLLRFLGRRVGVPAGGLQGGLQDGGLPFWQNQQDDYNDQVLETVRFLIKHGADIRTTNRSGETVLHALLHDNHYRRLCGMKAAYYNEVIPEITRTMELLLDEGADINAASRQLASPFAWAVQVFVSLDIYQLESAWPAFSFLLTLMLEHGADTSRTDEKGIHVVSMLFTAVNRWVNQCRSELDLPRGVRVLAHVRSLVRLFLKHGLRLSEDVLELCVKQLAILCNVSVPGDRGEEACALLRAVKGLLVPFITHGVNPHRLRVVTDRDSLIPCRLNAQFYLARAFIIHRGHQAVWDFFALFETALRQDSFNHLVTSLSSILAGNFDDNSYCDTSRCIEELVARRRTPRSLKVICKVIVSCCLDWRLESGVKELPLPKPIKAYLLDF